MKLNNKGWGIQVMMVFILILMICLVIIATLINSNFKELTNTNSSKSFDYKKLEQQMTDACEKYISIKNVQLENDDTYKITLNKLQNENLISEIRDDFSKCTGYSVIEKKNNKTFCTSYIKCGNNYKTKNYQ